MISNIALFRLSEKHKFKIDNLLHYAAINLRQFRPACAIGEFQLGYCVGALIIVVNNDFSNVQDDSEVRQRFWPLARESAKLFDNRVQNSNEKFISSQFRKFEENELLNHTSVSNMVIMNLSKYDCFGSSGFFKIDNSFTICNFTRQSDNVLMCLYVCTVNGRLCCSITNNAYFFDPSLVDEFISLFKDIIHIIID